MASGQSQEPSTSRKQMVWNTNNIGVTRVRCDSHMRGIATTYQALIKNNFETQVNNER
jgi:hypothetical protein